jgi:hypothetical protein
VRALLAAALLLLPAAGAQEFRNGWPSDLAEVAVAAYTEGDRGGARIPVEVRLRDLSGLPDDGWLLVLLTLPDPLSEGRLEPQPHPLLPDPRTEAGGKAWYAAAPLRELARDGPVTLHLQVQAWSGRAGQFEVGVYVAAFDAGFQPAPREAAYGFTLLMAHGDGWVGRGNAGWLVLPAAFALSLPLILLGWGLALRRGA